MNRWTQVWWVARRELLVEARSYRAAAAMATFGLLLVTLFSLAFNPLEVRVEAMAGGLLWLGLAFAALLGLQRSFGHEQADGQWLALLLAPMELSLIYYGKLVANVLLMAGLELVLVPVFLVLLQLPAPIAPVSLGASLVLGTVAVAAVGTLTSALAAQVRAGEILHVVLALPLLAPALLAAAKLAEIGLVGGKGFAFWAPLLASFDLLLLALPVLLFDSIAEV